MLDGYLSRPTGEGQHPAVVFLHGCGGLLMGWLMGWKIEPGESDWAGELTRRGYAILMVDSFAPAWPEGNVRAANLRPGALSQSGAGRLWGVVVSAGATFCSAGSHWHNGLVAGRWRSSLRDRHAKL